MFEDLGLEPEESENVDDTFATQEEEEGLIPPSQSLLCLGHEDVEQKLLAEYNAGKLPHALIFAGPNGIGKATFAYRFARFLLSRPASADNPTDSLFGDDEATSDTPQNMDISEDNPVLPRIASGGHPDFRTLSRRIDEKTGKMRTTLDIEEIREIPQFMRMTPAEGGWRIMLVDEAETMNRFSQNALLKILEEPPAKSLLILVTRSAGALIPTIRSRSRVYPFNTLGDNDMEILLNKLDPVMPSSDKSLLKAISGGQIGVAQRYYESDSLKFVSQLVASLGDYPKLNWDTIYALSSQLGQKGQDDHYACFRDSFLWLLSGLVRAKAHGAVTPDLGIDTAALKRLYESRSLTDLLTLHDTMQQHFRESDQSFLDRRQTVLNSYFKITG